MTNTPAAPQSSEAASLNNQELLDIFEHSESLTNGGEILSSLLREFLSQAMDTIQNKKLNDNATIRISEPVPIADMEKATGLVFPALLKSQPWVFIDTETTGLDDDSDAKLVELGMLRVADGMVTEFNTLINPGVPIPPLAASVHHITDEMVAKAPSEDDVRAHAIEFIGDATMVAHNAKFDAAFMNKLQGLPYSPEGAGTNRWLCSLRVARHALPDAERHNNQYLRYLFKTQPKTAGLGAHRAIDDVYVSVESLKVMIELIAEKGFNNLEEIKAWSDQPVPYPRMTYGKYGPDSTKGTEGLLLADVPSDYFDWMQKNDKGYSKNWDQRQAVDMELARRSKVTTKSGPAPTATGPLTTINFGKHTGRLVSAVDPAYLQWCCDNDGVKLRLTPDMRAGIEADLAARSSPPATPPTPAESPAQGRSNRP